MKLLFNAKSTKLSVSLLLLIAMMLSCLTACVTQLPPDESSSPSSSSASPESNSPSDSGSLDDPETLPPDTGDNGALGDPDVDFPEDEAKDEPPANPAKTLLEKSKEQYSEGNIGCRTVTLLSQYTVGADYDTYSYRDTTKKIFYIFLPCRADLSQVTFTVTHRNGEVSGPYTADFSDDVISDNEKVKGTTSTYTIKAMQSDRPTLMLQVDEQYGTVDDMNDSGNHSVYTYGDMILTVTNELAKANGWTTRYESVDENPDMYCSMEMRGRGNATWGYPKKGYQFELETNMDLLGLGRSDTFVLLANYNDASLMRNQVGLWLGDAIGCPFTSKYCQVDFFLNGEYKGLYMLTEKCDIGANRIEIDKNEDFLYEVNQKYQEYGEFGFLSKYDSLGKIRLHSPKDDPTAGREQFYAAEKAAYDGNEEEFLKHFDLESWAKAFIVQQITMNHDAYWGSFYFYYNHLDGKMYACTPWDFDYAMGVSWANKNSPSAKDAAENPRKYDVSSHFLVEAMMEYDSFKRVLVDLYFRQGIKETIAAIPDKINEWAEENRLGAMMNVAGASVRWYPDYEGGRYTKDVKTYDDAVEYLLWIVEPRIQWFDEQMNVILAKVGMTPEPLKGSGTESDPYIIATKDDYINFALSLGEGETFEGKHILQTADIDLSGFFPSLGIQNTFAGTYNGNGHSITIGIDSTEGCAFPKIVGIVMNVEVHGRLSNGSFGAGIARAIAKDGKLVNCISYVDVQATSAGGFASVTQSGAAVYGCTFMGTLNGKMNVGIIGHSVAKNTVVEHCFAKEGTPTGTDEKCTLTNDINAIANDINGAAADIAKACGIDAAKLCKYVVEDGKLVLESNK